MSSQSSAVQAAILPLAVSASKALDGPFTGASGGGKPPVSTSSPSAADSLSRRVPYLGPVRPGYVPQEALYLPRPTGSSTVLGEAREPKRAKAARTQTQEAAPKTKPDGRAFGTHTRALRDAVRTARVEAGMSAYTMGRKLGTSAEIVTKAENDKHPVCLTSVKLGKPGLIKRMADILGVDASPFALPARDRAPALASQLRAARLAKGLTLKEVARAVHCDPSQLAKAENGQHTAPLHPRTGKITAIGRAAKYLGIDIDAATVAGNSEAPARGSGKLAAQGLEQSTVR